MILRIVLTIFWYPALIIHELSHVIMMLLFFKIPDSIEFRFPLKFNKPLTGAVYIDLKKFKIPSFSYFIISLAPLFSFVLCIVFSIFLPCFNYLVVYQILAFNYILPSNSDLNDGLAYFGVKHKFIDYTHEKFFIDWLYPEWAARNKDLNEFSNVVYS